MGRIREKKLENKSWSKSKRDCTSSIFWGKGNQNIQRHS